MIRLEMGSWAICLAIAGDRSYGIYLWGFPIQRLPVSLLEPLLINIMLVLAMSAIAGIRRGTCS